MSADNGIYILQTLRSRVKEPSGWGSKVEPYYVYRVAHASAIDNFDYYEKEQPYNLGAYMVDVWSNSQVFETQEEALKKALEIESQLPFTEYGISFIRTEYIFYGDL